MPPGAAEAHAYESGFATGYSAGYAAAARLPRRCPIAVAHVPPALSTALLQRSYERSWATNNVERADDHFQYGVDFWMHRHLLRDRNASCDAEPPRMTYVPIYASFIHIFQASLKDDAGRRYDALQPKTSYIVPHTHPGTCDGRSVGTLRLQVDNDLCRSTRYVPVPYVVAHPAWLVARSLPARNRTRLLYFRGHLPKPYIDRSQTRRHLLEALRHEPDVTIDAANTLEGASYLPHEAYVTELLSSTFCLAPRGDTSSSKRVYEALAAGCIPVIVSDALKLPFERQLDWTRLSVRLDEKTVAAAPHAVVRQLRRMPAAVVTDMQRYLQAHRQAFLWHQDETRLSAAHYVHHELCAWAEMH